MRSIWDFVISKDELIQYDGIEREIAVTPFVNRIKTAAFGRFKAQCFDRLVIGKEVCALEDETFFNCCVKELIVSSSVVEMTPNVFGDMNGKGVEKIICTEHSPIVNIGRSRGIEIVITTDENIDLLYEETLKAYIERRSKYALCCGQLIPRHPVYSMLKETDMHDPSWDELRELSIMYQEFLCLNGNANIIEHFRDIVSLEDLSNILPQGVLEKYNDKEIWALFALTVGCMTPIVAVTDYGYIFIDRTMTPNIIKTKPPLFNCYKHLCNMDTPEREKYLKMLEDNVDPIDEATYVQYLQKKTLESQHTRYLKRLYYECSHAYDDEQRKVYNILIAIVTLFRLHFYKFECHMLKEIHE